MTKTSGSAGAARWTAILNTADEHKARKVLDRIGEAVGHEVAPSSMEPYWKIAGTMKATWLTPLQNLPPAEEVFATLELANRISASWSTSGVRRSDGDAYEFDAVSSEGSTVAGMTWARVSLTSKRLTS